MRRRQFIKLGAAALIAERFSGIGVLKSQEASSKVWEFENINEKTFPKLFDAFGGIMGLLPKEPGKCTVLIKPNICLPNLSGSGTVTNAKNIGMLIKTLVDSGVKKIIVADHTLMKTIDFDNIELKTIVAGYPEATLTLANEDRWFQETTMPGKVLKSTQILKILGRVDLFINYATAKHHSATQVSLCIKNLMGAIRDRETLHTGMDLHQAIGDLTLAMKPNLNIIDAGKVLLNGGPTGPGPIKSDNRLFASKDILAIDSVVASRYNFGGRSLKPTEILHLAAAFDNKAGEIDLDKIFVEKIIC
jgi:uncharacterized protein (DUF362 family)